MKRARANLPRGGHVAAGCESPLSGPYLKVTAVLLAEALTGIFKAWLEEDVCKQRQACWCFAPALLRLKGIGAHSCDAQASGLAGPHSLAVQGALRT